jgi:hypothetical protein
MSMFEEKEPEPGFKVVDRRSFTADGTRRGVDPAEEEQRNVESPRHPSESDTVPIEAEPEEYLGEADFETLVSYLSTTAMFQLGLLAGPSGERIAADLVNAQRTINLLEILQKKTRGNLTPHEEKLLDAALYELRLGFIEVSKRQTKKTR